MPNTGKPSPNCGLCRKRRVKCDLTRPSCLRCTNFGAPCPGYRQQPDLNGVHFRNYTSGRTKTSLIPIRSSGSDPVKPRLLTHAIGTGLSGQGGFLHIFNIALPVTSQYAPLLLHLFSGPVEDNNDVYNRAFFHNLLQESTENEPFLAVSRVFAHTYLSTTLKASPLDGKAAGEMYGKSVTAIRRSIEVTGGRVDNAVLAAVWLIGQYELLVGTGTTTNSGVSPVSGRWHVHMDGLISMLKARGSNQFSTETEMGFFWPIFAQAMSRYVIGGIPFPSVFLGWISKIEAHHRSKDVHLVALSRFLATLNKLTVKTQQVLGSGTPRQAFDFLPSLVEGIEEAEKVLEQSVHSELGAFAHHIRNSAISLSFWASAQGSKLRLQNMVIVLCNVADQGLSEEATDVANNDALKLQYIEQVRRSNFRAMRTAAAAANRVISDAVEAGSASRRASGSENSSQLRLPPWTVSMRCLYPLVCASQYETVPPPIRQQSRALLSTLATELGIQQASRATKIKDPWPMPVSAQWTPGCED